MTLHHHIKKLASPLILILTALSHTGSSAKAAIIAGVFAGTDFGDPLRKSFIISTGPPTSSLSNATATLDINGDGQPEAYRGLLGAYSGGRPAPGSSVMPEFCTVVVPQRGYFFQGNSTGSLVDAGATIGLGQFFTSTNMGSAIESAVFPAHQFPCEQGSLPIPYPVLSGYLPLRLVFPDGNHYGWINVENGSWAYESVVNRRIQAGVVPEPSASLIFLTALSLVSQRRRRRPQR
jgi:hypothetical protein